MTRAEMDPTEEQLTAWLREQGDVRAPRVDLERAYARIATTNQRRSLVPSLPGMRGFPLGWPSSPRLKLATAGIAALLVVALVAALVSGTVMKQQSVAQSPTPGPFRSPPATTRVVDTIPLEFTPGGVTTAWNWVYVSGTPDPYTNVATLRRFDPQTSMWRTLVLRLPPCPASASGGLPTVWVGFDSLWLLDCRWNRMTRVNMNGRTLATFDIRASAASAPATTVDVVAFDGANVWMIWNALAGDVARIDPATNRVLDHVQIGENVHSLGTSPGALWAVGGDPSKLWRVDAKTLRKTATIRLDPFGTRLLIRGSTLWTSANDVDYTRYVFKIDITTQQVQRFVYDPYTGAGADALRGNELWGSDNFAVSRIDAQTGRLIETIPVSGALGGVAEGFGSIWVADQTGQQLVRLEPGN